MNDNDYATHWRQAAPFPTGTIGKLRFLLRHSVLSLSSLVNRKSENKFLRCLFCHYVFDDQKDDFERLILELKRSGQFINTDTVIQMLQGNMEIDQGYYHLSFDDGFRNNFTNALPILRKHNVPAIFFIPSALIEASWQKIKKYCLETTLYNSVIEMLKWSDLHEIVSLGYEIGSHTKSHARFSSFSNNKMLIKDEILGSKKEIEANLKTECKYISWPYGQLTDVDDNSLKIVKSAGYKACFGAYRGTVLPGKTDIFRIPRHHFEVQWPISHVIYFAKGKLEVKAYYD